MRLHIITLSIVSGLLGGCAGPQETVQASANTQSENKGLSGGVVGNSVMPLSGQTNGQPAPKVEISLTEMLGLSRGAGCAAALEGLYTRVNLTAQYCNPDDNCGPAKDMVKSGFFKKVFAPESRSVAFVAKVGVQPDIAAVSHQLLLLTHNDNDSDGGETRDVDLLESDPAMTPYFLVKPETVVTVKVNAKRQDTLDTRAMKMLAQVTSQATNLLAPGSSLATELAKPIIRSQADNADKWLDLMFSSVDGEAISAAVAPPLTEEVKENGKIRVVAWLKKADSEETAQAATWEVTLADPRVSMFASDTVSCEKPKDVRKVQNDAGAKLEPSKILRFPVGKDKVIRDLISSENWYREASTQIAGADAKNRIGGIAKFCGEIPGLMRAQNFNDFDTTAILWAALIETPGFTSFQYLDQVPVCKRYQSSMKKFGLINSNDASMGFLSSH